MNSSLDRIDAKRLPEALAYFSLGLGAAEMTASDTVARLSGIPNTHHGLIRAMGLREVAAGAAMLSDPLDPKWSWARVGGDAIDLALIMLSFGSPRARRGRLFASMLTVLGVTALDVLTATFLTRTQTDRVHRRHLTRGRGERIEQSIAINCSPDQAYAFIHDFSKWPNIMPNLRTVQQNGDAELHMKAWINRQDVEWRSDVIEDRPNEMISWRARDNGSYLKAGSIKMGWIPGGRGTLVRVEILQKPLPVSAALDQSLDFRLREGLRRMKALIETGEIPTTIGQPSGRPANAVPVDAEVGLPMGTRALMAR